MAKDKIKPIYDLKGIEDTKKTTDSVLEDFLEDSELERIEFNRLKKIGWNVTFSYVSENSQRNNLNHYQSKFFNFLAQIPGNDPFKFLNAKDITKVIYFTNKNGYKGRIIETANKLK